MKINKLKELLCVLNGHSFSERSTTSDKGFVLRITETCENCGISVIDESGYKQRAKEYVERLNLPALPVKQEDN